MLPPLVAAKLALYEAMRAQPMTRTELARRLGLQENAVRRLLDRDHRSHIDQIDGPLAALGKRPEVRVLKPAWILTGTPVCPEIGTCRPQILRSSAGYDPRIFAQRARIALEVPRN
jgi:hypothetical protein